MTDLRMGCDYSDQKPDLGGLWAAGYRFILRYIGPGGAAKHLTATEVAEAHAHGFDIGLLAEGTITNDLHGYSQGIIDGSAAVAHAETLGVPDGVDIFYAVDHDAVVGQLSLIVAYMDGVKAAHNAGNRQYGIGVYGDTDACNAILARGVPGCAFMHPAARAWDTTTFPHGYDLDQRHNGVGVSGGVVDVVYQLTPHTAFWEATPVSDLGTIAEQTRIHALATGVMDWDINTGNTVNHPPNGIVHEHNAVQGSLSRLETDVTAVMSDVSAIKVMLTQLLAAIPGAAADIPDHIHTAITGSPKPPAGGAP